MEWDIAFYPRAVTELMDAISSLIAIRSTADRPDDLNRALEHVLALGFGGFTVERFSSRGKPSALVYLGDARPRFRVLFNAHLDVVPGQDDQFRPRAVGDRLYGRGTHDMKAAAVVMAVVFRDLARSLPFPVGLQLVTDEEVGGHDGTEHQIGAGVVADFVVIGEQSGLRVVTASKGICQVRVEAAGVAGHAAYPWNATNALLVLIEAVDRIVRRYPVPVAEQWSTTVTVSSIATGNQAVNQVPADATARLDIRFTPDDPDLAGRSASRIGEYLRELAGGEVRVTVENLGPPHAADESRAEVALLRRLGGDQPLLHKHGAADGRFYSARGTDAVIFGPGGAGQHGPSEYLDLATLDPYRQALSDFLTQLDHVGPDRVPLDQTTRPTAP